MVHWRVGLFYAVLLSLLLLSGKPLWWLPVVSLGLLLLSLPSKRPTESTNWHLWHPVFASLVASPFTAFLWRWVRYRKIIGGDSLLLFPTFQGSGFVLLDLSKNDIETLLHFVWTRALLLRAWGTPERQLLRLLELLQRQNERVSLSYLVGFPRPSETDWVSAGCFGVALLDGEGKKVLRILPTLGRVFWRTRCLQGQWLFVTDGAVPHLDTLLASLQHGLPPDPLLCALPREDDLTVGWLASKLKALSIKGH